MEEIDWVLFFFLVFLISDVFELLFKLYDLLLEEVDEFAPGAVPLFFFIADFFFFELEAE